MSNPHAALLQRYTEICQTFWCILKGCGTAEPGSGQEGGNGTAAGPSSGLESSAHSPVPTVLSQWHLCWDRSWDRAAGTPPGEPGLPTQPQDTPEPPWSAASSVTRAHLPTGNPDSPVRQQQWKTAPAP